MNTTHWLLRSPFAVAVFTSIGAWVSLGLHVSLSPPCIDVHFLWWTFSVMSAEHGEEIRIAERIDQCVT